MDKQNKINFDELLKMDDPLAGPPPGRPSLGEVLGKKKKPKPKVTNAGNGDA